METREAVTLPPFTDKSVFHKGLSSLFQSVSSTPSVFSPSLSSIFLSLSLSLPLASNRRDNLGLLPTKQNSDTVQLQTRMQWLAHSVSSTTLAAFSTCPTKGLYSVFKKHAVFIYPFHLHPKTHHIQM